VHSHVRAEPLNGAESMLRVVATNAPLVRQIVRQRVPGILRDICSRLNCAARAGLTIWSLWCRRARRPHLSERHGDDACDVHGRDGWDGLFAVEIHLEARLKVLALAICWRFVGEPEAELNCQNLPRTVGGNPPGECTDYFQPR
jgi:hypothetical protein